LLHSCCLVPSCPCSEPPKRGQLFIQPGLFALRSCKIGKIVQEEHSQIVMRIADIYTYAYTPYVVNEYLLISTLGIGKGAFPAVACGLLVCSPKLQDAVNRSVARCPLQWLGFLLLWKRIRYCIRGVFESGLTAIVIHNRPVSHCLLRSLFTIQ